MNVQELKSIINSGLPDDVVSFSVGTYSIITDSTPKYCHWSEGLKMVISKNGVTIKLNSDEIQELVKSLPRTIGGSY